MSKAGHIGDIIAVRLSMGFTIGCKFTKTAATNSLKFVEYLGVPNVSINATVL